MDPFAGDCRSQPWDRNLVAGDADGTSGGRGGSRRFADRGASTADQGTFRRTAATEAGELLGRAGIGNRRVQRQPLLWELGRVEHGVLEHQGAGRRVVQRLGATGRPRDLVALPRLAEVGA